MASKATQVRQENLNPIIKRIAVLCKMTLLSPALIGSGESENSKRDIYRDAEENPIIPGTSLAGVLRNALDEEEAAKLFGRLINSRDDASETSPLWVFDAPLYNKPSEKPDKTPAEVIVIDNVALDENKVAKPEAKFDFEAVECGTCFDLRLLLFVRNENRDDNLEELLKKLLDNLNSLYVGGKTSRGFGKLKCVSIHRQEFHNNPDDLEAWMHFKKNDLDLNCYNETINPAPPSEAGTICATLRLDGSLLIRNDYSVVGDENTAHITSTGLPVIYGTSWAGAIRSGLERLLKTKEADFSNYNNYLNSVFGCSEIDEKTKKQKTHPSKIRIDASYFAQDKRHLTTRVKIDRWTGGSVERALFTARPQFGGHITLTIYYSEKSKPETEAVRQLLLLALKVIDLGIIAIGGETSIGRGVFKVEEICVDGVPRCKKELFDISNCDLKTILSQKPKGGAANG